MPFLMQRQMPSVHRVLLAMLVPQGVDYDALDGQPVHMIFFDRSTEYRRECASGSTQPSFHAFNG